MIPFGPATRIFLAPGPTDMRRSFDGLAETVRQQLGDDPLSGHLYIFTNRRRNRLKILVWDGSGLWVCAKRLEEGTFRWPTPEPGRKKVRLSAEELGVLEVPVWGPVEDSGEFSLAALTVASDSEPEK